MDSLGLTMFIPLLQIADQSTAQVASGDTSVQFVHSFFNGLHIEVTVINVLLVIVLLFILKGVFFFYTTKYVGVTKIIFSKILRERLAGGLRDLSYKEFVATDVGRLQNSLTGEVERVIDACGQYLDTLKNTLFVIGYLGVAFCLDWKFSILVAIGGGLSNFIYKVFYTQTQELSRKITKNNHRYGGLVIEIVNHFKYLKATGRNHLFFDRLSQELRRLVSSNTSVVIIGARLAAMREPLTIIVIALVIVVHVLLFKAPLSAVMIILLFFYRAMQKLIDLQMNWNNYLAKTGTLENIISYQKYLDDHREVFSGKQQVPHIQSIELKDVCLNYDNSDVLKKINLKITKNQSVAFVGESGAGKTSLINVICSLTPVSEGDFFINEKEMSSYINRKYKEKIGYISQEPTIFNASVYDNISFWDKRTAESLAKFQQVVDMCSLRTFLTELPEQENTLLGNNGVNISGGQKQRISIARELYREVELLIMDEATSALDSETEYEIKESIESLQGKVTIISIAHRLSTIRHVDKIYLMDKGQIVAQGSFEELQREAPYFKKLTELQGM
jgi:ABC-type multidrug transport system, ATPase and permease components